MGLHQLLLLGFSSSIINGTPSFSPPLSSMELHLLLSFQIAQFGATATICDGRF
jgi:hypothetical protein